MSEEFKSKHGREPVFWIDKYCIDQADVASSVVYLPIDVMACKKMLVLAGPTYFDRLWCNWELYAQCNSGPGAREAIRLVAIDDTILADLALKVSTFDAAKADAFKQNDKDQVYI